MNPLFNNYENSVLNTNARITYNPTHFRRYNVPEPLPLPEPDEITDENIHIFNPIVTETITVNRNFTRKDIKPDVVVTKNIQNIVDSIKNTPPPIISDVKEPPPDLSTQPIIISPPKLNPEPTKKSEVKVVDEVKKDVEKEVPEPAKKPEIKVEDDSDGDDKYEIMSDMSSEEDVPVVTKKTKKYVFDKKSKIKPILINKLDSVKRKTERQLLIDRKMETVDKIVINSGNYFAFPIINTQNESMYIYSIDLKVSVSSTNTRGTLYYSNRRNIKKNIDKTKWTSVRHSIRFFSYNPKVLNKDGGEIHIELKEIEIPKGTVYFIFEIDEGGKKSDVTFFTGKIRKCQFQTMFYDGKVWKALDKKISNYYGIWGRQWKKKNLYKKEKIDSDVSKYVRKTWQISVQESRYYYFMIRTIHGCTLEIDGKELVKSNRCKKGTRCSHKLDTGQTYTISLVYTNDDPDNYFAWTNKYNKNWISDLTDESVIKFKLI